MKLGVERRGNMINKCAYTLLAGCGKDDPA